MSVREWHRLSEVNEQARTGTCSQCGPVTIRIRAGRGHECGTRRREQDARRRARLGPWRLWRISPESQARLSASRQCAICAATDTLGIDHDHQCCPGKYGCDQCVRDWLCRSCNLAIAYLEEDAARLERATDYVTRWQHR